jgi:hypothetical protein
MVGSIAQESKMDPNNQQPGGPGYGLGQWTNEKGFASYTALLCYAKIHGKPKDDFVMQLHFSIQQNTDVTKEFKSASNASEAEQAVTDFEHFGVQGNRFADGQKICANVVCSQPSKNPYVDDPGVGVPAGTGLANDVSDKLGCGTDLYQLIQLMRQPYSEPAGLGAQMKQCLAQASGSKKQ